MKTKHGFLGEVKNNKIVNRVLREVTHKTLPRPFLLAKFHTLSRNRLQSNLTNALMNTTALFSPTFMKFLNVHQHGVHNILN